MIRFLLSCALLLTALSLLPGCASENIEDLTGEPISLACDTTGLARPTYSGVIKPIIQNRCVKCHVASGGQDLGAPRSQGGTLDSYDGVKRIATLDVGSEHSLLLEAITHGDNAAAMPKDLAPNKLPSCEIDKIRRWVERGAPND